MISLILHRAPRYLSENKREKEREIEREREREIEREREREKIKSHSRETRPTCARNGRGRKKVTRVRRCLLAGPSSVLNYARLAARCVAIQDLYSVLPKPAAKETPHRYAA